MTSFASISINFDTINDFRRYPVDGENDPSYTVAIERILEWLDRYQLKATFFLIGKDLAYKTFQKNIAQVLSHGHEIGNHSYQHYYQLGNMAPGVIAEEIKQCHIRIREHCGVEAVGFTAPAWSYTRELITELENQNYLYDCSLFPSWIRIPMYAKLLATHAGGEKFSELKSSWKNQASAWIKPMKSSVVELPVPTNHLGIAIWHTLAFAFPWKIYKQLLLDSLRKQKELFYYTLHPADFLETKDLGNIRLPESFERLFVPWERKKEILDLVGELLQNDSRKWVTLRQAAEVMKTQ